MACLWWQRLPIYPPKYLGIISSSCGFGRAGGIGDLTAVSSFLPSTIWSPTFLFPTSLHSHFLVQVCVVSDCPPAPFFSPAAQIQKGKRQLLQNRLGRKEGNAGIALISRTFSAQRPFPACPRVLFRDPLKDQCEGSRDISFSLLWASKYLKSAKAWVRVGETLPSCTVEDAFCRRTVMLWIFRKTLRLILRNPQMWKLWCVSENSDEYTNFC